VVLKADQKKKLRELHPTCYVCGNVGLPHADFEGYADTQVQYDHGFPQGLVGGAQADLLANIRPIHAAAGYPSPLDDSWETAKLRNCHAGKSDRYTGPEWIDRVRIQRLAIRTHLSDELIDPKRGGGATAEITWNDSAGTVTFMGLTYPMMTQQVGADPKPWRSFSTLVPQTLLWTDDEVQPRDADPKRLADLAWHLRTSPLLSPILARWSPDQKKIKVFDGNHRLLAYIMARGEAEVPVTIFDGPDPLAFLAVAVEAHDNLTQLKYQYSDKALKYSALTANELHEAAEKWGSHASEEKAWAGLTSADVRLRTIGAMSRHLQETGGWRKKWHEAGLTDQSWNRLIETYARTNAEVVSFEDSRYYRGPERANMEVLCTILDEELFEKLSDPRFPNARASLKTKWWKRAHVKFANAIGQVAMDNMELPNQPRPPAYCPPWSEHVRNAIREMATHWRQSPAWNDDTTANNEAVIDQQLDERQFTEHYLRHGGKK
jgi:hypothetical protein